jgi:heme a synthase
MASTAGAAAGMGTADSRAPIAYWLFVCAAMVFAMVVLGGVTRLTESGLSIVEWRPATGFLPPLSSAEWQALFDKYQLTPEFQKRNFWMGLADFQSIFWLEFIHRVWGRVIGIVFLVPFLYFLARGRIGRRLGTHLGVIFLLGAAQGFLGWYMVKSGLVQRPDVSQYRLAAHLALALAIYGYLIWIGLGLRAARAPRTPPDAPGRAAGLAAAARGVVAWISLTVIAGAFVAGLDAGHVFNTFPLMDGRLVPRELFHMVPWPVNFFENAATVQFTHRMLAITLVVIVAVFWHRTRRAALPTGIGRLNHLLGAATLIQFALGIATLLLAVPVSLGALHQAGALVVFTLALILTHALTPPTATRAGATRPAGA